MAVLSQKIDPPMLGSGTSHQVSEFLKLYAEYERKIEQLEFQGISATAIPITSCMSMGALKHICKYRMKLQGDAWKDVKDIEVKSFLLGQKHRSEHEVSRIVERLRGTLKMEVSNRVSAVDAATTLFEALEEFKEKNEDVISEKKICELIIAALRPLTLKSAVMRIMDEIPEWEQASHSVENLYDLVMQEAELSDRMQARKRWAENKSEQVTGDEEGKSTNFKRSKVVEEKVPSWMETTETGARLF
jgi:hypothetical protein